MVDVYGETVVTWVNGKRVCESTGPDGSHPSGAIALTTGPNATLQYQSITLEEWADGPAAGPQRHPGRPPSSGRPPTPPIDTARRVWASQDMTFENYEPGRWRELNPGCTGGSSTTRRSIGRRRRSSCSTPTAVTAG